MFIRMGSFTIKGVVISIEFELFLERLYSFLCLPEFLRVRDPFPQSHPQGEEFHIFSMFLAVYFHHIDPDSLKTLFENIQFL